MASPRFGPDEHYHEAVSERRRPTTLTNLIRPSADGFSLCMPTIIAWLINEIWMTHFLLLYGTRRYFVRLLTSDQNSLVSWHWPPIAIISYSRPMLNVSSLCALPPPDIKFWLHHCTLLSATEVLVQQDNQYTWWVKKVSHDRII